jgi:DNA-binding transcriptional LysR family regulator
MTRINLDMAVLRMLVTAQQLGSFNRAAGQIGRSQSAVSQQIRKLEDQVGEPLFRKQGRTWLSLPLARSCSPMPVAS